MCIPIVYELLRREENIEAGLGLRVDSVKRWKAGAAGGRLGGDVRETGTAIDMSHWVIVVLADIAHTVEHLYPRAARSGPHRGPRPC